jgi:cytochrome c-type biogenesis protein CcmF
LMGIAQYFWWKKIKTESFKDLINPLVVAMFLSVLIIIGTGVNDWKYIILILGTMFSIVCNATILLDLFKGKVKVAGGAISHIGIALMLLGIMFSSAYEKTVSINTTSTE